MHPHRPQRASGGKPGAVGAPVASVRRLFRLPLVLSSRTASQQMYIAAELHLRAVRRWLRRRCVEQRRADGRVQRDI